MYIFFFLFAFSCIESRELSRNAYSFLRCEQNVRSIELGGKILTVEIADTPESMTQGLMGRARLPCGQGMLFVYKKKSYLSFWMKNTLVPLSIAFFDENKALTEILDMDVPSSQTDPLPIFKSARPSCYALEVPQHWFHQNGIVPGMKFSFLDHRDGVE